MRVRHFIKFQRPSLRLFNKIAEHALRWLHSSDQALCERAIVRLASSQQDGDKSSLSICECMNLRVSPSARAANSLLLLPPYGWPAPHAELGRGRFGAREGFHGYCSSGH